MNAQANFLIGQVWLAAGVSGPGGWQSMACVLLGTGWTVLAIAKWLRP